MNMSGYNTQLIETGTVMRNTLRKKLLCLGCLACATMVAPLPLYGVEVSDVWVDVKEIHLDTGEIAGIGFTLDEPAKVSVFICDLKGRIVRTLLADADKTAGNISLLWDGHGNQGESVPGDVYVPIIKATSATTGSTVYNPTAGEWGADVLADNLHYDPASESVTFTIKNDAYARLRVGIREGGPVYRTVTPWQRWQAGSHQVPWNGMDQGEFQRVSEKPGLAYSFDSFVMPENSLVVSGGSEPEGAQPDYGWFPVHPPSAPTLTFFALEPGSHRPELSITMTCPAKAQENTSKPLHGKTDCRIDATEDNLGGADFAHGAEFLIYVDDEFVVEVPVKKLPATIGFDTRKYKNGAHRLTANILTDDDRAGIATIEATFKN